jgi:glycosyltransferase involved in cell wall biosynthesis
VRLVGYRTDIPEILDASDLLVVTSTSEGCSVAILEAMAAGRAVVATRIGGTPEIVSEGHTGLLIQPNDPSGLAEAVLSLARDPQGRKSMGSEGARLARERYSIQTMVARLEAVYLECLGLDRMT